MTVMLPPDGLTMFLELARLPTPSQHERAAADLAIGWLRALGLDPVEDDAGPRTGGDTGNILARIPATGPGTPIVFCAHLDTVPPTDAIEPVIVDGIVRNARPTILGSDNKATVAGMIEGVRKVLEAGEPHPTIELLLTPQEETGLVGVEAFDTAALEASLGFVYDHAGPLGGIVTAAPGQRTVTLSFTGTAAHAGIAPEDGVNAIAAAADAITRMRLGRIDLETTANVGLIAGGLARNIVAPNCVVEAEVRSRDEGKLNAELEWMLMGAAEAADAAGCRVESSVRAQYRAYRHRPSDPVVTLSERALAAAGYTPRHEQVGGGADAHTLNQKGIPSVVLTSGMHEVHTPSEWIAAADVEGMARITVEIVRAAAQA